MKNSEVLPAMINSFLYERPLGLAFFDSGKLNHSDVKIIRSDVFKAKVGVINANFIIYQLSDNQI